MRSRSKYELDEKNIIELFKKAGIDGAENISSLGAGEFNTVYSADAGGKHYALKVAPVNTDRMLTYEKDMMRQEVYYYSLMREAGISVPEVYFTDFSRENIETDYFIMERLTGKQLDEAELNDEQKAIAGAKLAGMAAKMHSVKGDKFGYRQNGLHDNWHSALKSMVENLIKDCENLKRKAKRGKKLLLYIEKNKDILKKAECSLINFDIWPPNIFCETEGSKLKLSWIDPERCLWGDRIADFVCLDFINMSLEKKENMLREYNRNSENPINPGREENIRLSVMLAYLALIMEVEKYARYSIFHFGYWRNVMVSNLLYKNAFRQLEEL